MESDRSGVDPATILCPVCGDERLRNIDFRAHGIDLTDPLLTTPVARLCAVAIEFCITVHDLPVAEAEGCAGALALDHNDKGKMHGTVFLAEDLDDGLRADAFAFGIAALMLDTRRISETPRSYIWLSPTRLPAAKLGSGHLAWHIARTCGRITRSATFDFVELR